MKTKKVDNGQRYPSCASIEAVLRPSAQNATMCTGSGCQVDSTTTLLTALLASKTISFVDFAVLTLMNDNGLRITEVLNIVSSNINANGSILIKGLKGSRDRLVFCSLGVEYWVNCRRLGHCLHSERNRFYYYRLCKKIGLGQGFAGKENQPTTHFFRHKFATSLLNNGASLSQVQDILGHKSINSTKFYDDREK